MPFENLKDNFIPVIWNAVNLMTFITEYRRAERVGTGTAGNLYEQVCLQTDQVAGPSAHAENGMPYSRERTEMLK